MKIRYYASGLFKIFIAIGFIIIVTVPAAFAEEQAPGVSIKDYVKRFSDRIRDQDVEQSKLYFNYMLELSEEQEGVESDVTLTILTALTEAYNENGHDSAALEYCDRALDILEVAENKSLYAKFYPTIIFYKVYLSMVNGAHDTAGTYCFRWLENIDATIKDPDEKFRAKAAGYAYLSEISYANNEAEAETYADTALRYLSAVSGLMETEKVEYICRLARAQIMLGKQPEYAANINKALKILKEADDLNNTDADGQLIDLADALIENKNDTIYYNLGKKCVKIFEGKKTPDVKTLLQAYLIMLSMDYRRGNFEGIYGYADKIRGLLKSKGSAGDKDMLLLHLRSALYFSILRVITNDDFYGSEKLHNEIIYALREFGPFTDEYLPAEINMYYNALKYYGRDDMAMEVDIIRR